MWKRKYDRGKEAFHFVFATGRQLSPSLKSVPAVTPAGKIALEKRDEWIIT